MSNKEIYDLLKTLNMPVAYNHFDKKLQPPFILYTNDAPITFNADDHVYKKTNTYIIWLATDKKDLELEEKMEQLLDSNYIPYDKDETFIDDEKIYQVEYTI